MGAWIEMSPLSSGSEGTWAFLGESPLLIDSLNAPLLPLASLLYLMTVLATLGGKLRSISFSSLLISEAILLATLSWRDSWGIALLLIVGILPTYLNCAHHAGNRDYLVCI
jgi:hypothetical protein